MKWEDYNTLTPEQKEEYMFKFGDKPRFTINGFYSIFVLFACVSIMLMLMYLLSQSNESFIPIRDDVEILFHQGLLMSRIGLWVAVAYVIPNIIDVVSFYVREKRWWGKIKNEQKESDA